MFVRMHAAGLSISVMQAEHPEAGTASTQFADVEPWALPRVYADYLPCFVGVHPLHGAKVAYGQYVGVPSIPFGHIMGRQGPVNFPNTAASVERTQDV